MNCRSSIQMNWIWYKKFSTNILLWLSPDTILCAWGIVCYYHVFVCTCRNMCVSVCVLVCAVCSFSSQCLPIKSSQAWRQASRGSEAAGGEFMTLLPSLLFYHLSILTASPLFFLFIRLLTLSASQLTPVCCPSFISRLLASLSSSQFMFPVFPLTFVIPSKNNAFLIHHPIFPSFSSFSLSIAHCSFLLLTRLLHQPIHFFSSFF